MPRREIQKVLEAEQFVLRDTTGRARAALSLRGGEPIFQMLDAEGRQRAAIQLEAPGRAVIRLEAADGSSVGLSVDDNGDVGIGLARQTGLPMLECGCRAQGDLRIVVYDKTGIPVWQSIGPNQGPPLK